ncbi:Flp pilus assembly protein CpaB [Thermincola potens]|uniref:SAF domain protein n=1 Tax=Thermincola potens (strain JR) TaxID=635013 RepID=D5XAG8_THEPJ|nr:SAF domain-containing protein [Thermincola potens]ADG81267.1 SAF domain protein [Thermincola potens JR]
MEFKKIGIIFVILSILLSFGAAYLFLNMVQKTEKTMGETVQIITASKDVEAYTPLTRDKLSYTEIPRKYLNGSFLTNEKEVLGKVTLVPMAKNDIITRSMIKKVDDLPKEVRIVQLRPPVVFDSKEIEPGDRVDIIGTFALDNKQLITQVIQSDIIVHDIAMDEKKNEISSLGLQVEIEKALQLINNLHRAKEIRVLKQNYINH